MGDAIQKQILSDIFQSRSATRGGQSGNCPPTKISQTHVFVRCSNKLHHFPPRKYQFGCGPVPMQILFDTSGWNDWCKSNRTTYFISSVYQRYQSAKNFCALFPFLQQQAKILHLRFSPNYLNLGLIWNICVAKVMMAQVLWAENIVVSRLE